MSAVSDVVTQKPARRKAMRVATVLTGIAGLAAAGTLVAEPAAYAGTNGQKVEVCDIPFYGYVSMNGHNQSGRPAATNQRHLGDTSCWEFTNYWWKGPVQIKTWYSTGVYAGSMRSNIRSSVPYTNWETCYMSLADCLPT